MTESLLDVLANLALRIESFGQVVVLTMPQEQAWIPCDLAIGFRGLGFKDFYFGGLRVLRFVV